MAFWGYNNEKEARNHWPKLDEGRWETKKIRVCTRGKSCMGSLDGKTFMYADGTTDNGIEIEEVMVILGNIKIGFTRE